MCTVFFWNEEHFQSAVTFTVMKHCSAKSTDDDWSIFWPWHLMIDNIWTWGCCVPYISNDLTDPFTNANSYVMICVFGEDDCIAGHCLDHFSLLCAVYWSPLAAARIICTRLCGKGITCMLSFPDIGSKAVQVRANKYSETDELSNCFLAGRFPFCATKLLRAKSLKFCWKKNACADHWWLIIWALHFWGLRRRLIWMLNLW